MTARAFLLPFSSSAWGARAPHAEDNFYWGHPVEQRASSVHRAPSAYQATGMPHPAQELPTWPDAKNRIETHRPGSEVSGIVAALRCDRDKFSGGHRLGPGVRAGR